MTKPTPKNEPIESAWIGNFKISPSDRKILEKHIDSEAISRIEAKVAEHQALIRPYIMGRPTSTAITAKLTEISAMAKDLRNALTSLDGDSKAQLGKVVFRAKTTNKVNLDLSVLKEELDSLDVLAGIAARHTPEGAGAGVRTRGKRPVPDAALVEEIAKIVAEAGVNVRTVSPGSDFVAICQAVSNSGGFRSNDVRGSICVFLRRKS